MSDLKGPLINVLLHVTKHLIDQTWGIHIQYPFSSVFDTFLVFMCTVSLFCDGFLHINKC